MTTVQLSGLFRFKWVLLLAACGGMLITARAAAPVGDAAADTLPPLAELAAQRYQIAEQGYQFATAGHKPGEAPGYDAVDWMKRRVKARLDIPEPKADRVAFLREYVEMLRAQENFEEKMVRDRLNPAESLLRIRYDRVEGEMLLQQAMLK